jgi:hypothetical protein
MVYFAILIKTPITMSLLLVLDGIGCHWRARIGQTPGAAPGPVQPESMPAHWHRRRVLADSEASGAAAAGRGCHDGATGSGPGSREARAKSEPS